MFFRMAMQRVFSFGAVDDLTWVRDQLRSHFGAAGPVLVRAPIDQLVKSLISSRTRDEVSSSAYGRLMERYSDWSDLARARPDDVKAIIWDVTFSDVKAVRLGEMLRSIAEFYPDLDLAFLGRLTVSQALRWLERLPGVGRKVAASTLNFSTLTMPAFVIDTHILRILRRYGLVGPKADTRLAFDAVMALSETWSAVDLAELHIFMKRLGQTVCRADHGCCRDCPIRPQCKAAASRNALEVAGAR